MAGRTITRRDTTRVTMMTGTPTMPLSLRWRQRRLATMPSPTACRPTSPTIRRREPISALTACGTPARKRSRHLRLKDGAFECAVLLVCCSGARRQHHAGEREEQRGDLAGAERLVEPAPPLLPTDPLPPPDALRPHP